MFEYILRLFVLIPLVGALAWGSLWMWRRVQSGAPLGGTTQSPIRMISALSLGTGGKLAVVEFGGRTLLIAVSRNQIALIADDAGGAPHG